MGETTLKMPVLTREETMDGDYAGFKFEFRKNFKAKVLDEFSAGEGQRAVDELLAKLLTRWNFPDEDGNPLPQPNGHPETMGELPLELKNAIVKRIMEAVQTAPNP
jgi:hypothetical protein